MMKIRKSEDRGYFDHGWLKTHHSFSFADYYDTSYMGFRSLRVINEDWIGAGEGFGTHPHRDMEIVTYVLKGALEHKDSMGNGSVIRPGDIQYMSAGKGVTHSEFNHSPDQDTHLLQIWILPDQKGYEPRYGQKSFSEKQKLNKLVTVASPDGREDSVAIRQNTMIKACILQKDTEIKYSPERARHLWLQLISGKLRVNDLELNKGDGLAVSEENEIKIKGLDANSEFLLFDLE